MPAPVDKHFGVQYPGRAALHARTVVLNRGTPSSALHPEKRSDGFPNPFRSRFNVSVSQMGVS